MWLFYFRRSKAGMLNSSYVFKMNHVRTNSSQNTWKFHVIHVELLAGFAHQLVDFWVVNMADTGKQMMFYLKIQTTCKPGNNFTAGSKICSCLHLMNCPFRLYFVISAVWCFEYSIFNDVGKLKHDGNGQSANKRNDEITQNGVQQANHENGHNQECADVQKFTRPKDNVLFCIHFPEGRFPNLAGKVFAEILYINPQQIGYTI